MMYAKVGHVYRWMHGIHNNINNDIKKPVCGYQIVIPSKILIFGGYLKGEIILMYMRYLHLGQNYSKTILTLGQFYLGIR